jgi:O-antigen/teichoic acid export membrane protein
MERRSIKVRFVTTMIANMTRVALSFVTGLIIARTLGPSEYGNFTFLVGSFTAIATLVDMGSSSAFFTFISQSARGRKFFVYYGAWILIQLVIIFCFVLLLPWPLKAKIWLGNPKSIIFFALFSSFTVDYIWRCLGQIGESIRDTLGVQIRNILLICSYLACVLFLAALDLISLRYLLTLNIILYFSFAAIYGGRLYKTGVFSEEKNENYGAVIKEYKKFCLPLVVYSWVGFFYTFADFWLLQKFGGAEQQGYYAVGARFASLSLLATVSVLQILWKEIAEAYALGDFERIRDVYGKVTRTLYFVSALVSCLLIPLSRDILSLLLGPSYQSAWLTLSLMFLYPVHQSLGQITGTMLFAIGRTKVKSIIGLIFMFFSIPVAYLLLAPGTLPIPGLQLGAVGLAIKMVVCQLIDVNLMVFFVARYIKAPFDWGYQFIVLLVLLSASLLCKFGTQGVFYLLSLDSYLIFSLCMTGVFYLSLIVILLYYAPSLAGLNHQQLRQGILFLKERLNFV